MPRGRIRSPIADLIRRHGGKCFYCGFRVARCRFGSQPGSHFHATRDHLMPRSLGGSDAPGNVVLACFGCNQLKQNMTLTVFVLMVHFHALEDRTCHQQAG